MAPQGGKEREIVELLEPNTRGEALALCVHSFIN